MGNGGLDKPGQLPMKSKNAVKEVFVMRTEIKRKLGLWLALLLSFCLVVSAFPFKVLAVDGPTMTFEDFLKAVEAGNGTYDGNGVTVEWEPVSGCEYPKYHTGCLFNSNEWVAASAQTPQRVNQLPNAQYQLFSHLQDIRISNVNFKFVPADFILCKNSAWKGICKAETTKNAEFQFQNTGDVTLENCTFDQVIASPYGDGNTSAASRSFTVTGCTFKNVYNAYALKDIYPATATITGNTFIDCSGAIYFEGNVEKKSILIQNNTFNTIDTNAASGKEYTRGVVQFSGACKFSNSSKVTLSGNTITGNLVNNGANQGKLPVFRQLTNMGSVTVDGWTPGAPFSILNNGSSSVTLPAMPSGNGDYIFQGWAKEADYKGPTDLTNQANFLQAGEAAESGTYYYAVWKAKEIRYTVTVVDSYGENGWTGAGTYLPGERVVINAGTPDELEFTGWTTDSPIALVDADETITSFIMPKCNVTVVANWKGLDDGRKDPYLKINKLWVGDDEDVRPESVEINVYHEDELFKTVTIYEKYEWMGGTFIPARWEDDYWWVEEKDLPEHYDSEAEEVRHLVFDVTNTYDN